MSELATFWNGNHKLSAASDKMSETLMPMSGNCATLQGELYRASTRISYDWFNNGWGCNNWSGAVVFLQQFFRELPVQPSAETLADLEKNLRYVHEYSHGEPSGHLNDDKVEAVVTRIHEIVVQTILDSLVDPSQDLAGADDARALEIITKALVNNPKLIPNTRDMFDFQEPEYRGSHEDDEDEDGYY